MDTNSSDLGPYHLALGQFIHAFAELELDIKLTLAIYAKTQKNQFQALWSGTRGDAALSFLRRIRDAKGESDPIFDRWATQFKVINDARNLVVHLAPIHTENGFAISNSSKALPGKATLTPMSWKELHALRKDVETLRFGVGCSFYTVKRGRPPKKDWVTLASAPWQYTPPPPPQQSRNPKRSDQKHLPPPKS